MLSACWRPSNHQTRSTQQGKSAARTTFFNRPTSGPPPSPSEPASSSRRDEHDFPFNEAKPHHPIFTPSSRAPAPSGPEAERSAASPAEHETRPEDGGRAFFPHPMREEVYYAVPPPRIRVNTEPPNDIYCSEGFHKCITQILIKCYRLRFKRQRTSWRNKTKG